MQRLNKGDISLFLSEKKNKIIIKKKKKPKKAVMCASFVILYLTKEHKYVGINVPSTINSQYAVPNTARKLSI